MASSSYYVSNSGSDSNSGSLAAPFATVAKGIAAAVAGDSIYLQRGSVFGPVTLSKSGTPTSPITLGAYGVGNDPLIAARTSDTAAIYGGDVIGWRISALSTTGGASGIAIMQVSDNSAGMKCGYVTISGCTVRRYGTTVAGLQGGILVSGRATAGQSPIPGIVIDACTVGEMFCLPVLNYDKAGIMVRSTTGAKITRCKVASVSALGITARTTWNNPCNDTVLIDSCTLGANQGNIAIDSSTTGGTISNCVISNSYGYGIGLSASSGLLISNNDISNLLPSADGTLYNGIDCNNGAINSTAIGNRVRRVAAACMTLEADNSVACTGWTLSSNSFDSTANVAFDGQPAAVDSNHRTYPIYVRDLSLVGLSLKGNALTANPLSPYVQWGATSAGDKSHDITLAMLYATKSLTPGGAQVIA